MASRQINQKCEIGKSVYRLYVMSSVFVSLVTPTHAPIGDACHLSSSLADCLQLVGDDMPRVHDVIPTLDVDNIVGVLTAQLQDMGSGALYCPHVAPTWGVVFALISSGPGHTAFAGVIIICLLLASTCDAVCSLGLGAMALSYLLLLVVLMVQLMLPQLRGCACFCNSHYGAVWDERHLIFDCAALPVTTRRPLHMSTGGIDTILCSAW